MTRIKMYISKVKLPFYSPCEVKCGLQNGVSTVEKKKVKVDLVPRPRRDFFSQAQKMRLEIVSLLYKEPVYRIVEKIKNASYFHWPNKMSGDVMRRNQNLYCSYHQDRGYTTEDCRILEDHLHQLKKAGYLGELLVREDSHLQDLKGETTSRTSTPTLSLIGVIHAIRKQVETMKTPPRILTVNSTFDSKLKGPTHKKRCWEDECIAFTGKDLMDIVQPHEDALVVTLRIRGFDVKKVVIDQGSGVEIM